VKQKQRSKENCTALEIRNYILQFRFKGQKQSSQQLKFSAIFDSLGVSITARCLHKTSTQKLIF